MDLSPCGNDQRFFIFRGVAIRIMKVSVKNITNVTTKHGFVEASLNPTQGGSVTNRANFPPQGGFETRPYDTCGFFILRGGNCHES